MSDRTFFTVTDYCQQHVSVCLYVCPNNFGTTGMILMTFGVNVFPSRVPSHPLHLLILNPYLHTLLDETIH